MSAIIKNAMRPYKANQFLNIFGSNRVEYWTSGTSYTTGDVKKYLNSKFIATSTGLSGGTPPTHLSGKVSDGGVTWLFVEANLDTDYYENNAYISIGKLDAWDDDANPPVPLNNDVDEAEILENSAFLKRISAGDAKLAIVRHDWIPNVVYSEYDDTVVDFNYPTPYYVINSSLEIFKCISNNGGVVSTSAPTGQGATNLTLPDGYVWKFVATVSASDAISFLTADYVPVGKKLTDDGSTQWAVQQSAINGSLSSITVVDGGSDFTATPTVIILPSQGETPTSIATATANLTGGVVSSIDIVDAGGGYIAPPLIKLQFDAGDTVSIHEPEITIAVDGSGVITDVTIVEGGQYHNGITSNLINTAGGSGAILTPVLDANNVLTSFTIDNGGTGYADLETVTLNDGEANVFAHDVQISVTNQPKAGHGANIIEELNAKNVIISTRLDQDESGFLPTDISFRQIALVLDPSTFAGDPAIAPKYIGSTNANFGLDPANDIQVGSGVVLYVENIQPVLRGTSQIEELKVILKF